MPAKIATKRTRRFPDYTFEQSLVRCCAICGVDRDEAVAASGYSLAGYIPPISADCPVATFVGVCRSCLGRRWNRDVPLFGPDDRRTEWTPPPLIRVAEDEPLFVVRFGHADDAKLARVAGRAWSRVPARSRVTMRKYLRPRIEYADNTFDYSPTLAKGALRVEALRTFPNSKRALGTCVHEGHTIRLRASLVAAMPDDVLATLLAHELAHVYQHAARMEGRVSGDDLEADAKALMDAWGFRDADIDGWLYDRDEERFRARMSRSLRPRTSKQSVPKPSKD